MPRHDNRWRAVAASAIDSALRISICSPRVADLALEIVEGPGAGRQLELERPITIGRDPDSDLVLDDGETSRHHARVTPSLDGSATVEDLGSTNGTFINGNELHGPARLDPGDQLLIGVTVVQLRSREQIARQASAVIEVPPSLRTSIKPAAYVNPEVIAAEAGAPKDPPNPALDKYLDVRVRRRAQVAPLALFLLVAIALIIYFATK
jgi:predicted component of type VI protein secretion system